MSTHRSRGVDRHAAEQLLAGSGAGPLASVLRAAAAPAYPEELAGEDAVLAAFRDAPAPEPRRASAFRTALAKVLTVKALIVVAVAGSTGIVLAASGGALPLPWSDSPAEPSPVSSTPVSSTAETPAGTSQVSPPSGRTADTGAPPATAATPAPSELSRLAGLCEAHTVQVGEAKGKALETPAFTALVEAAGGAGKVDDYCATVVPTDPPRKPDDLPTTTSRGGSGGAAGNLPTNIPSSIPTNVPGNIPGDPPSSRPATPPGRAPTPGSPAHGAATAVPPAAPYRHPKAADPDGVGSGARPQTPSPNPLPPLPTTPDRGRSL